MWLPMHRLQLAAAEDGVDLPLPGELQAPCFGANFGSNPERSRPLCSQLLAAELQWQVLGRQPHLVADEEGRCPAAAVRLALHPRS